MQRREITLNLDGQVVARVEALSHDSGEPMEAIVERALVRHMGRVTMGRVQKRFGLDDDEALSVAYEELKGARGEK